MFVCAFRVRLMLPVPSFPPPPSSPPPPHMCSPPCLSAQTTFQNAPTSRVSAAPEASAPRRRSLMAQFTPPLPLPLRRASSNVIPLVGSDGDQQEDIDIELLSFGSSDGKETIRIAVRFCCGTNTGGLQGSVPGGPRLSRPPLAQIVASRLGPPPHPPTTIHTLFSVCLSFSLPLPRPLFPLRFVVWTLVVLSLLGQLLWASALSA
jgi:hypothetical protein